MSENRRYWTVEQLLAIHNQPIIELISQANAQHIKYHDPKQIQVSSLISIKTGGCPEDCKYCSQSSRYQTATSAQALMEHDDVLNRAKEAIAQGATRICLGAAWREVREGKQFDQVLRMIQSITALGAEVCCTLGFITELQAQKLKAAGLYAYNHNLDSSEEFYKTIITTRSYSDRLKTLDIVEKAGLSVCCGGILGMGETAEDRMKLLHTLSLLDSPPESVPINRLIPIPGTPLGDQSPTTIWEVLRMIATTRIVLPYAMIRLSAGRISMSYEEQALCFLCGVNSLFLGEKLLTVANSSVSKDLEMFQLLGLTKRPAFVRVQQAAACSQQRALCVQ